MSIVAVHANYHLLIDGCGFAVMTERAKTTLFDRTAKIHVGFGTIEVVWSDKGGFAGWCLRAGLRLRECGINDCHEQKPAQIEHEDFSWPYPPY